MRVGHRREIQALVAKKQSAIRAANNAFQERDFELARASLQIARETEAMMFQREQAFADRQLQVSREMREAEKFDREIADDTITRLTQAGGEITDRQVMELSGMLNLEPAQVRNIMVSARLAQQAQSEAEELSRWKDIASIMRTMPAGTQVPIGSGQFMTAVGQSGDIHIADHTDSQGNVIRIQTNKVTGGQTTQNLGPIGKPIAGGGNVVNITPSGARELSRVGFNADDIKALERNVNQYGALEVLDNLRTQPDGNYTQEQMDALETVLKFPSNQNDFFSQLFEGGGINMDAIMNEALQELNLD